MQEKLLDLNEGIMWIKEHNLTEQVKIYLFITKSLLSILVCMIEKVGVFWNGLINAVKI